MTRHDHPPLNPVDILVLVAIARLGDTAYGVTIREAILRTTDREASMAAVYAALDRLQRAGLAEPWRSEPRPERGGRARRHFRLTEAGRHALRHERDVAARLFHGLELGADGGGQ